MTDYKVALAQVLADPRYQRNLDFGAPRPGHPEGSIRQHIADLEANLERLRPRLRTEQEYWQLKFLIHVHDTFKAETASQDAPTNSPASHAALARAFASRFTSDPDLLNILEFHDANYILWQQVQSTGDFDHFWFETLLDLIQDWDLYLVFTIIDGYTQGKDLQKLPWFINLVRQRRPTRVEPAWADLA